MTIDNASSPGRTGPEPMVVPESLGARTANIGEVALSLSGVTKTYPGVTALDNIDFECCAGEVHALVGENGSGKSTLIKVAAGVLVPDAGTVQIGGTAIRGGDPREARRRGLMTAYQDTSLVAELTVAENIELSFHTHGDRAPGDIKKILAQYDLPFRANDTVKSLGPGGRAMLEVVRALVHSPSVLVLDEPTAALDMQTAEQLQNLIIDARDSGMAIVYVSHRLEEVRRLADRLTVLRDGVIQGTHAQMNWEIEDIVELMVGAPVDLEFPQRTAAGSGGAPLLEVRDIEGHGVGPVSITVGPGEIVGIAGAEGSGQRNLLRAIIGLNRRSGEVHLAGRPVHPATPTESLRSGISFQSGDRSAESVFPSMSIMDNGMLQQGREAGPAGLSLPKVMLPRFRAAVAKLGIVAASPYQPIAALSGGNQQKIVLSRPLQRRPKVLIVDEPSQGVDARARLDIYASLVEAADAGVAVLINSSDSSELAGLCDRVYVMADGVVIDECTGTINEADIVRRFVSNNSKKDAGIGAPQRKPDTSRVARALASPQVPVVVLLALIALAGIITTASVPFFLSSFNVGNMLVLALPLICVALGQQFALLTGEFDISVGASMTVAVCIASFVLSDFVAGHLILGVLLILGVGIAVGLLNAFLTRVLNVNPIVATIATMGILTGVAVLLRPRPDGTIAPELSEATYTGLGPVPYVFIGIVVIGIALDFWLHRTGSGLAARAVGLDYESSHRIGVRANRTKALGYIAAAVGAAAGGIFLSTQVGIGSNAVALGLALPTFTACFLGGATLTGGRGTFLGAMLGALFLTVLSNATQFLGVPFETSQLMYGGILLAAVATYALAARRA
ncbi:ATP-binding cassette domain-containing protein [Rhodococcus sp. WS1]|uniref:ATP-binding cassette domain-containing protein n=1 Tax=unclassified Rhodococcus (in: high G+C Gram-positive bacteria) TaxID=192944 RepID=UPI0011439905|nr:MULTISPECIES: ATP-binding cassette domain-containing protein [unclassified Rhodococcus (in: high G+C Gram-positive bacteria)]ROZ52926.1 ATP-binding cassette domain-containing protein [Rhodococcus sp. WS1]TQC36018.1 ATP-binding cassette domain-containing protein [Rhodococcus sp. WS7]